MSKHERFTTAVNDSTGDLIKTKASGQEKYAKGWEAIFGKEEFIPYNPPTTAEQVLQKLTDDGKLNTNMQRRHEEQNIGKGKFTQDDVEVSVETPNGKVVVEGCGETHPLLGLGTKLGIEYGDGLEYQNMVREGILSQPEFEEEEPTVLVFTEQLLPSGIIGDEV